MLNTPPSSPASIPLLVPPWDEQRAFKAGAKYAEAVGFHVPGTADRYLLDAVHEWLPLKWRQSPALLPEMLPKTTWNQNLRYLLTPEQWDRIRRYCYKAAGYRCEICGAPGNQPHLECHEKWSFHKSATKSIQRLDRVLSLCPLCHKAHHLGFAASNGMLPEVLVHIAQTNEWTDGKLTEELDKTYRQWQADSKLTWELDLSWLTRSGYDLVY